MRNITTHQIKREYHEKNLLTLKIASNNYFFEKSINNNTNWVRLRLSSNFNYETAEYPDMRH